MFRVSPPASTRSLESSLEPQIKKYPHQPIQKRLPGELVNQGRLEARGRTAVLEVSRLGGKYPGAREQGHQIASGKEV
eukprot:7236574-Pyramimonas_sp.AAC.1